MVVGSVVFLIGVFACFHSLITWDPGLHGVKLGIGFGGVFWGALIFIIGYPLKKNRISETQ